MFYQLASVLLDVLASLVAGACLLRLAMQWQRLPFQSPLGRFVFAVTDWLVLPLRRLLPGSRRWDTASLLAAWLIKLLQMLLLWWLAGFQAPVSSLPVAALLGLLQLLVSALSALVLVYGLLSWLQPGSYMHHLTGRLSEPWLYPLRKILPLIGGMDLSPLALLLLLQMVGIVLSHLMRGFFF